MRSVKRVVAIGESPSGGRRRPSIRSGSANSQAYWPRRIGRSSPGTADGLRGLIARIRRKLQDVHQLSDAERREAESHAVDDGRLLRVDDASGMPIRDDSLRVTYPAIGDRRGRESRLVL